MTLQEAKSIARHLGLTLRKVRSGHYRVNFRKGDESTACYAVDLEDAVNRRRRDGSLNPLVASNNSHNSRPSDGSRRSDGVAIPAACLPAVVTPFLSSFHFSLDDLCLHTP